MQAMLVVKGVWATPPAREKFTPTERGDHPEVLERARREEAEAAL